MYVCIHVDIGAAIDLKGWIGGSGGKMGRKKREICGVKILPSDIICLITIQGSPVGYIRACG